MNMNTIYLEKFDTTVTIKNKLLEVQREFYQLLIKLIRNRKQKNKHFIFKEEELNSFLKKQDKILFDELSNLQNNIITIKTKKYYTSFNLISSFTKSEDLYYIEFPNKILMTIKESEDKLIDLIVCKNLKSKYSIYLYDYINNTDKTFFEFTVDEFKEFMYIGKNEYKTYPSIKSKIINPMLEELNQLINIQYTIKKEKNKTKNLIFIKN